jgi:hypothetical protein
MCGPTLWTAPTGKIVERELAQDKDGRKNAGHDPLPGCDWLAVNGGHDVGPGSKGSFAAGERASGASQTRWEVW